MDEEPTNPPADPSMDQTDYSRGRFMSQSTMTLSRGMDSTRLLFMGDNFQQQRSDQDIFFDCLGPEGLPDSPKEGRSATSRCKFDDPTSIREALERAANTTQMLLKNFDSLGGWNRPCAVTLELTARLVDPKKSRIGCPLHGKPVTVQMPLEFNPQSGKIASCQQKQKHPPASRHRKESICQCRSQQRMGPAPRAPKPSSGKSASEQLRPCESQQVTEGSGGTTYMGSCGDSTSQYYRCTNATCGHRYDPEAREVISICVLPLPEPEPEPFPELLPTPPPEEESLEDLADAAEAGHLKIDAPAAEP
uniref:Uncharacterized protein LOC108043525 n=1 Tax=Drosophila rhopaloa TaxID=1041015 RepID=A0A6P4EHV4_DRORH